MLAAIARGRKIRHTSAKAQRGRPMTDFEKADFFTDPSVANDNPGYVTQLRGKCPVLREPHHGVFMVTGYDEAMEVLSTRAAAFSSVGAVPGPIPPLPFTPEADDIREQVQLNR